MSNHHVGCPARNSFYLTCICDKRAAPADEYPHLSKLSLAELGRLAECIGREIAQREQFLRHVGECVEQCGREIGKLQQGRLSHTIPDSNGRCSGCGRCICVCVEPSADWRR